MPNPMIKKSNGQVVAFEPERVKTSIRRTGVDEATVNRVYKEVEKVVKPNVSTKEIYKTVAQELAKLKPWAAARYDLKKAIHDLGPAGYHFEKYIASILTAYGYKTETPDTYKGACIEHEIDVTAEKDGRRIFIEAKFRRDFNGAVNIKDTMATWARFLDLVDGSKLDLCPHFDEVWIVTNARFTDQSLAFGHCKNMKLVGWNHPEEKTLAQMVDLNALYPVTIIPSLKPDEIDAFAKSNIMLCRELGDLNPSQLATSTGLKPTRAESILNECTSIVDGDMENLDE